MESGQGIWPERPPQPREVTRIWPRVDTAAFVQQRRQQKRQTGLPPEPDLPPGYDDNRVVLLVRDPYCLFAYWEIGSKLRQELAERYTPYLWENSRMVLRLHDLSSPVLEAWDIPVHGWLNTWYLHVPWPEHTYRADLGVIGPGGQFILVASSNLATTPPAGVSTVTDEAWLTIEEIYHRTTTSSGMATSPGFKEAVAWHLVHEMGSPFLFGFPGKPAEKK